MKLFSQEGQGRTKQQAKHQSAAAVLGLLKDPPRPMQPGEVGICEEGPSSEGSGEVPTAVLIDVPLPPTWAPSRQENASVRLDSMPPSSVQTDVFTAETYQSNKETNSDSDTTCDSIVKAFPLVPNGIAVTNNKLRSRETFTKKTADVLTRPLQPSLAYLYHISMRQTYTYEDELRTSRTTDFHIETAPLCFGLVNASPLPPLNPFPIFIRSGEIEVQLERRGEIVLGDETLKRLRHFNRFLFREVLRLEREPMVHSETEADQKFLMVPLNREREIDLDFLERIFAMDKFLPRKPSEEERQAFVYDSTRYQDTVITPWYRGDSISEFHFVVNVWKNKTPNSGFPEKERLTFKQYYEEKYQEKIYCDNQPLLQGLLTTSRPGFDVVTPHSFSVHGGVRPLAAPMQVSKRQSKRGNQPALYVPELCSVHPFPASLWQQALCLPYSLAKINALLLADELRLNFAQALHLGAPPPDHRWDRMDVGWSLKDVLQTSGRENEEQENEKNPSQMELFPKVSQVPQFGPSPGKILVALTMINAFECANQERLELMGDAFLKYAVSVKLFIDEPTKQEGDMTRLRSQIVSNEYLYLLGKHLGLGHRVVPSKFSATDSWLPPGYGVDKSSRRGGLLKEQQLHPKNIADTVEALIGAYLTSCGHDKALAFMRQIGIEVIPTSTQIRSSSAHFYGMLNCEDFRTAPEDFRTTSWKEQGFEELEETLGYQFGDGRYLLQALTHKSFVERQTESMERLEFLGDAVLGYVVTQYLYEVCKQSDPGELTDIRTAIVNNLTFACVAVQVGLHRPLKIASPVAEAKIKGFVDFCKSRTLSQVVRSEEGLAMEDVQSVEGIDVPKELGDVLEAVAGAVFLDSGLSLAVVWRVFGKVLKEAIQEFTERVPKNPVRQLYELKCGHVTVEDSVALNNGMMKVVIEVHGERKFEGIGPNGKIAKYNAALTALMYLRKTSPQL
ncbi:unnamed protein product [Cyprideis torosa]|uniref:Uncharacterized protein n=1 Tax=Cyprideis torosa TaxID=163714 RepID=A0A7R8WCM7_9CRUS|nr:unnamed protein product [Cyprideis torosa]CAG0888116.1 unnamed protein product [Cyprideis torosa]